MGKKIINLTEVTVAEKKYKWLSVCKARDMSFWKASFSSDPDGVANAFHFPAKAGA